MVDFFKILSRTNALCLLVSVFLSASLAQAQESDQLILVHYMPWFVAKSEGQGWGYHWTMNRMDPNNVGEQGRREIASFNYPQIGPYDSSDPHVLEYHVLLMKLSGIDGVIVDWYGSREYRDYPMINRNTRLLIPWLKKAGLKFTFCYEDQTVKHMVADKTIKASEDVTEFATELNKLADEYFSDEAWVKSNNKPILLTFGPQHFKAESWKKAIKQCNLAPAVFGLPYVNKNFELAGSFAWPPVHGGGIVTTQKWKSSLKKVYDGKKPNPGVRN